MENKTQFIKPAKEVIQSSIMRHVSLYHRYNDYIVDFDTLVQQVDSNSTGDCTCRLCNMEWNAYIS